MRMRKAGLPLFVLLASVISCRVTISPPPEIPGATVSRPLTWDGKKIALFRLEPKGSPFPFPVILCHGLGSNRFSFHGGELWSLPLFLREMGFETYVLELRGHGINSGEDPGDYNFDTLFRFDMRRAIAAVKYRSGKGRVIWIGHSMGGMLLYPYIEEFGGEDILAGVTISSPVVFSNPGRLLKIVERLIPIPAAAGSLRGRGIVSLFSRLGGKVPFQLEKIVFNLNNINREERVFLMRYAVEDIEGGLLSQVRRWLQGGRFTSFDGKRDYHLNLFRIRTPILVMTGGGDHLAPPFRVIPAFEGISSDIKGLEIVSASRGYREDYGHVDIVAGGNAQREVYPAIIDFLRDLPSEVEVHPHSEGGAGLEYLPSAITRFGLDGNDKG